MIKFGDKKLIEVFEDTMKHLRKDDDLRKAINKSRKEQFIVLEGPMMTTDMSHRFNEKAQIVVSNKRTFEAASSHCKNGKKVCVLNFANAFHPGGGVKQGCKAQEEALCRCSTLYPCISEKKVRQNYHERHSDLRVRREFSNLANDDCIYTPNVVVMKSDSSEPTIMSKEQWYRTDVITCAAPDLRNLKESPINVFGTYPSDKKLMSIHKKRGRRILDLAKSQKVDVIILGAFGCGAFRNPPEVVANAYKQILGEYMYDFETIEFAIVGGGNNYEVFEKALCN